MNNVYFLVHFSNRFVTLKKISSTHQTLSNHSISRKYCEDIHLDLDNEEELCNKWNEDTPGICVELSEAGKDLGFSVGDKK